MLRKSQDIWLIYNFIVSYIAELYTTSSIRRCQLLYSPVTNATLSLDPQT